MSRTDKTRPYALKLAEAQRENPYLARREAYWMWRPGLHGCKDSCWMCSGWRHEENRKTRRQAKAAARDWEREYR